MRQNVATFTIYFCKPMSKRIERADFVALPVTATRPNFPTSGTGTNRSRFRAISLIGSKFPAFRRYELGPPNRQG
jgi:hypothetical protein